ncbi:MAG TPA: glycosyltransferase [Bryobacteraceae bacterium]|nr:glycosyltransferase [Bryobacteraceae bacterium]
MMPRIFSSFFQAGFECSTHKLKSGRRLDLIASTRHDRFLRQDYARLREVGIRTAREGLRWHLIENNPGHYDFSSVVPFLKAAHETGIQIVWDLFHFGWPDHLDIFDARWVTSFVDLALHFARLLKSEGSEQPFIAPVNEISFFSWAGGDVAYVNPFATGRGPELKRQLVRAAVQATDAVRSELPQARMVSPEPVIHIVGDPTRPEDVRRAEEYRLSMFEAWDMLSGHLCPELGGAESCLDIIGVNYYDRNQWWNFGKTIRRGEPEYRPFHQILQEVYDRYRRPMFVSETGTEDAGRPDWLSYIAGEVRSATEKGVSMHGICLYPILNHPGWDDDRHCYNGLWDYASDDGFREIYSPLADEIEKLRKSIETQEEHSMSNTNNPVSPEPIDLICFSHLRWEFVFQRPQHLMGRFARQQRVFFIEEPLYGDTLLPSLRVRTCPRTGVVAVTPSLPESLQHADSTTVLKNLMAEFLKEHSIHRYFTWFYTPMALDFAAELCTEATVYDCMDELSMFRGAPSRLQENEQKLFDQADLVFTGGVSLFEAKCHSHPHVYVFPSSVDVSHFAQARSIRETPEDQKDILRPRLGYAGVIDERMDLDLIDQLAMRRPEWQIVMLGPIAKIDPTALPRRPNIHWLGLKAYQDLPQYFAGWDVALLPFALNDSTRFISPTKTPEYLAAGLPVVSTPIRDVVTPYGKLGLVRIAQNAEEFLVAAEQSMVYGMSLKWRERADAFLRTLSWDKTWCAMNTLIQQVLQSKCTPAVSLPAVPEVRTAEKKSAMHV